MRLTRKLMLVTAMAVTALALSASSAMAQETPVEIYKEGTADHCGVVSCPIHVVGNSTLTAHVGGVESVVSGCSDEFTGSIGEDGSGTVTSISLTGASCNSVECRNAAGDVTWPFSAGELGGEREHFNIEFCLFNAQGQFSFCDIEVQVGREVPADHHYVLSVSDFRCPSGIEVNGSWEVENSPTNAIEIHHLDDEGR